MLDSYSHLLKQKVSKDETLTALTNAIMKNQKKNLPVHKWKKADLVDLGEYRPLELKVEEFMQTDLFTVEPNDIIELVGEIMDWRKIRYVPVEDVEGNLKGLVTSRLITRQLLKKVEGYQSTTVAEDIMIVKPLIVKPEDTILDAMKIMRKNKVGSLLVVKNKKLVGMITESDFLDITSRLLERMHSK